jgi:5-methylcytosine-specific restriction protein A
MRRYDFDRTEHDEGVRGTGFYESEKWKSVRDEVRKRDDARCQTCGRFNVGRMIVDHIRPITKRDLENRNFEKLYGLDNLQLLCQDCHNRKTAQDNTKKNTLLF